MTMRGVITEGTFKGSDVRIEIPKPKNGRPVIYSDVSVFLNEKDVSRTIQHVNIHISPNCLVGLRLDMLVDGGEKHA